MMRKQPKAAGHAFKIMERREQYGHRAAALYTAACECGCWRKVWPDRLSVLRSLHGQHVRETLAKAGGAQ